jgi:hypothetical protein
MALLVNILTSYSHSPIGQDSQLANLTRKRKVPEQSVQTGQQRTAQVRKRAKANRQAENDQAESDMLDLARER